MPYLEKPYPRAVFAFVDGLDQAGVTLPPAVARARDRHAVIVDGTVLKLAAEMPAAQVLTLDEQGLAEYVRARAFVRAIIEGQLLGEAAQRVDEQLRDAATDSLHEHADDVLDQLRPRFDTAAGKFADAVALGVRPGMTADDVIAGLPDRAARAWRQLPEAAGTLDEVRRLREGLSLMADLPPVAGWDYSDRAARRWGACYSQAAPPIGERDGGARLWLRLATLGPLRLHTVAETDDVERATRPRPVPVNVDADLVQLG